MHFLYVFSSFMENTWFGKGIRDSLWIYPFIQLIHFTGLSLWLGTNLAVDLRLVGIGRGRETAAQLNKQLIVWNWIAFAIVLTGGLLLFSSNATTFYYNAAFRVKIPLVITALTYHIILQQKTKKWGETPDPPGYARFAGLMEILLWLSVVVAAVEIPNY
jgi:uncharacterized membrane protein